MTQPTDTSSGPTSQPNPIPPTPNPNPGVTSPTQNPTPSTGPTLTEQQMMGHHALVAMGVKAATIKKIESEEMDEFTNLLVVSKETLEELKSKGIINSIN